MSCTCSVLPEIAAIVPVTPFPAACPVVVAGLAVEVGVAVVAEDAEHPLRNSTPAATTARAAPVRLKMVDEEGRVSCITCSVGC